MQQKVATADKIFLSLNQIIEKFIFDHHDLFEIEYRKKAKRTVHDSEINSFFSTLGDYLYDNVEPDDGSVQRFLQSFAAPHKLQLLVDQVLDGVNSYSFASKLQKVAMKVALSQPLQEQPDYGSKSSAYLHDKTLVNPEKLNDWVHTADGQDLLQIFDNIKQEIKQENFQDFPNQLQNLIGTAGNLLNYVKS